MWASDIKKAAERIVQDYAQTGFSIATAESCTGGLIAAALTEISGSSSVVDRGYVTYSNAAKISLLGVSEGLIEANGAVSEPVALAMAKGAKSAAGATTSIAVTGVAGPTGGSTEKPVGTVWIALAHGKTVIAEHHLFRDQDRSGVRLETVRRALALLQSVIKV